MSPVHYAKVISGFAVLLACGKLIRDTNAEWAAGRNWHYSSQWYQVTCDECREAGDFVVVK